MSKKEPFGIYIHIPYCKAKCRYCDFYSAPGARGVPQSYVDALLCIVVIVYYVIP